MWYTSGVSGKTICRARLLLSWRAASEKRLVRLTSRPLSSICDPSEPILDPAPLLMNKASSDLARRTREKVCQPAPNQSTVRGLCPTPSLSLSTPPLPLPLPLPPPQAHGVDFLTAVVNCGWPHQRYFIVGCTPLCGVSLSLSLARALSLSISIAFSLSLALSLFLSPYQRL